MPDTDPPRRPLAPARGSGGPSDKRAGHDARAFGDKVAAPDPATAPLGTDDEASGVRPGPAEPPPGPATPGEAAAGSPEGTGRTGFILLAAVLAVALIAGLLMLAAL